MLVHQTTKLNVVLIHLKIDLGQQYGQLDQQYAKQLLFVLLLCQNHTCLVDYYSIAQ